MHGRVAEMLFWTAIGFVAASFVLAFIGVETSPGATRELIFRWHEAFGLLSLIALLATLAAYGLGKRRIRGPMRNWLPRFRAAISVIFYALLFLQPFSGWLLASHEGKPVSVLGWMLPPLASPSSMLAEFGVAYHALGGGLILIIAALTVRLNLEAYALGSLARLRRRQRARAEARDRASRDGALGERRTKSSNKGP